MRVYVIDAPSLTDGEDPRLALAIDRVTSTVNARAQMAAVSAVNGRRGWIALASRASLDAAAIEDLGALMRSACSPYLPEVAVGVGAEAPSPDLAWISRRQGEMAVRLADLFGAAAAVEWEGLGAYQFLAPIPAAELDEALVSRGVRALLDSDPQKQLLPTVECYLRHAGGSAAAAAELHIHRTTLYYRLDRARELTGLDVDDGAQRMELQLGIAVHRLREARLR